MLEIHQHTQTRRVRRGPAVGSDMAQRAAPWMDTPTMRNHRAVFSNIYYRRSADDLGDVSLCNNRFETDQCSLFVVIVRYYPLYPVHICNQSEMGDVSKSGGQSVQCMRMAD